MATFSLRDIQRNCCVVYDDESGETADVTSVQPRGWTATLDGQRVAAYVDDNSRLILQIATDKFDLDSGQTRAFGRNDYATNTANFRITEDDRSRHLRYHRMVDRVGLWRARSHGPRRAERV